MILLGGSRETPPIELRAAMIAKLGLASYSEVMDMDVEDIELLEHIGYSLNKKIEIDSNG